MNIASIGGWALDRLVRIDSVCPGLMSHFCLASNERRHVIAAFLSVDRLRPVDLRETALFLQQAGHGEILRAAFTTLPAGLRGALARTEPAVQPRRYYQYLCRLLRQDDGSFRRLVDRLPVLNLAQLRVARILPADARLAGIIERLPGRREARDLTAYLDLIADCGADREAMITAFKSSRRSLHEVARHWSLKTRFPHHPVAASDYYMPIASGEELRRTAEHFRNCMRVYVADVLDGICAFGIFGAEGKERAIVHLQRADGAWALQGLHGPRNLSVAPELRQEVEAYLRQHDILVRRRSNAARRFDPVRRLTRHYVFDDDD